MTPRTMSLVAAVSTLLSFALPSVAKPQGSGEPIPRNQDRAPNAPRSPEDAARAMTVPSGFTVEVVASEPDLVNPVAMTFDERGRIWVTESLEYPRASPGPGRDRIKILEDTDGDGRMDKTTIFAEGLNIPSGIALGGGGVWVANAPDILFLRDTNGDDRADTSEVVVTGFGRDDTHELPNSLTWGPDGWLYGLNGVFNRSIVKQGGKTFDFTCALWRIHPRTRVFELFAEGVSNSWGVTWNEDGEAFLSACVIDHLWHIVESGYYHRQGGPYPPFTWKLESIVDYKHQKAAYCGIHYFDSDAYPPAYRDQLYMGNIHGGCINVDGLRREGSSYRGVKKPDFLTANDAWFMPIAQKTGPDGSLYILDWYDRYHCYQDAQRDPEGIDRLTGRIYRVRYRETPRVPKFDLTTESDDQLIARLGSPNIYFRDLAQRLLRERNRPETRVKLQGLVLSDAPRKARMHALWTLIGADRLDPVFHLGVLAHADPIVRAWGVRAAGEMKIVSPEVRERLVALLADANPSVALQLAIASRKVEGLDTATTLLRVLEGAGEDGAIPPVVWQNLQPTLATAAGAEAFVAAIAKRPVAESSSRAEFVPRAVERFLQGTPVREDLAADLTVWLVSASSGEAPGFVSEAAKETLGHVVARIGTKGANDAGVARFRERLGPLLGPIIDGPKDRPLYPEAVLTAASWGDRRAVEAARELLTRPGVDEELRLWTLEVLASTDATATIAAVSSLLSRPTSVSPSFLGKAISTLANLDDPRVAIVLIEAYPGLNRTLQPRAIEVLTGRPNSARPLLEAIRQGKIGKEAVNLNQVRKLSAFPDPTIAAVVRSTWGTNREGRDPRREAEIAKIREQLASTKGDAIAGAVVFKNLCAQCHKIYGEGQEVGPDLTSNGRSSFDQLVSNVLDPSLVIGESYRATSVATTDGRVVTGLQVEDSPRAVAVRIQGGKLETFPRDQVEAVKTSPISLMPEAIEAQYRPQELADLFAFLTLDRPPTDPQARPIPGTPDSLIKSNVPR